MVGGLLALPMRAELAPPGLQSWPLSGTTSCSRGTARSCSQPGDARMVRCQLTEDASKTLPISVCCNAAATPPTWGDKPANTASLSGAATSGHPQPQKKDDMLKSSLTALARQQLVVAKAASSGRSASTVFGGHENIMRQTIIALAAGQKLSEHDNPGEATVHVLQGRVRLGSAGEAWEGSPGDLLIVPDRRHDLEALDDAVVLLTVAKRT
jgi:quercetin dioxygenase-like cupin family protein